MKECFNWKSVLQERIDFNAATFAAGLSSFAFNVCIPEEKGVWCAASTDLQACRDNEKSLQFAIERGQGDFP